MTLDFQTFIDDSYTPNEVFVLGGHIAMAKKWAEFSKDWEALLPLGTLSNEGAYHFKMAEMAMTPERMSRVPAFYRIIEKYVALSISCRMNLSDFSAAKNRFQEFSVSQKWRINLDKWANPYFFLCRGLIDEFHKNREGMAAVIPLDEKVDFIFDNQTEKGFLLKAWDGYLKNQEKQNLRQHYGATPRFEDDKEFLPLQAADLWAWWVREWCEEDAADNPTKMENFDFGTWKGKKRSVASFFWSEQQIHDRLVEIALQNMGSATDPDGNPIFPDEYDQA
jgi:hypothetical protein